MSLFLFDEIYNAAKLSKEEARKSLRLLLEGNVVDQTHHFWGPKSDLITETPAGKLAKEGAIEAAELLREEFDANIDEIAVGAVRGGNYEYANQLRNAGADINKLVREAVLRKAYSYADELMSDPSYKKKSPVGGLNNLAYLAVSESFSYAEKLWKAGANINVILSFFVKEEVDKNEKWLPYLVQMSEEFKEEIVKGLYQRYKREIDPSLLRKVTEIRRLMTSQALTYEQAFVIIDNEELIGLSNFFVDTQDFPNELVAEMASYLADFAQQSDAVSVVKALFKEEKEINLKLAREIKGKLNLEETRLSKKNQTEDTRKRIAFIQNIKKLIPDAGEEVKDEEKARIDEELKEGKWCEGFAKQLQENIASKEGIKDTWDETLVSWLGSMLLLNPGFAIAKPFLMKDKTSRHLFGGKKGKTQEMAEEILQLAKNKKKK